MGIAQWSTTPANNASGAAPINWAEGQAPSTVNDSARQMMADVATWYQAPEWLNYGLTPTFVSATQFTVPGNQTGIYSVGRRVRAFVTAGTVYGTVTASAFASQTTVTVALDSGNLDSGISEVDVGILNPANSSLDHLSGNLTVGGGTVFLGNASTFGGGLAVQMANTNTNGQLAMNNAGTFAFNDQTRSISRFVSDTAGNFTVAGNMTASSDERLKEDWSPLDADFIDRLAKIRSGTYTRIDTQQRHVGVGAQSLQALLPEAVLESDKGMLSVAYGQAALAACVELAKEVVRLRALLEPLK
jgi:hypothetical protein